MRREYLRFALIVLLAACIVRLWVMPLRSSFWVDEMVSAFVIHYGSAHPSLAVAPQVTETIYYWLPKAAESMFGFSEAAYRIPSLLVMAIAVLLIAGLAARLIHPQAGWFAAFACLSLRGFNYEAADARPYALGTCVAAAGLWFLVRWLDDGRWRDGLLFVVFAALLWRVHLVFWPFYLIFGLYLGWRFLAHETRSTWRQAAVVVATLGLALLPVLLDAVRLLHEAGLHVIVDEPTLRDLRGALKLPLVAATGAGALLLSLVFRWKRPADQLPSPSTVALIVFWWVGYPVAVFAFSWISKDSLFVPRYLSLALPGAALAATLAAAYFIPQPYWKPCAAGVAAAVLILFGQWRQPWPAHHNSDWREAARKVNEWSRDSATPIVCPSPFIEARSPVWEREYPLPGFLYSYLPVYTISGTPYLLPFRRSPEADSYAAELAGHTLAASPRFMIYGGDRNVWMWRRWFAERPELRGWGNRLLGPFGDVEVAIFERPVE